MAWAPIAMMALGTGLEVTGTLRQGREEANTLATQARIAQSQGYADEQAQRREGRQVIGRQAAAMAESGGGQDEGLLRQSAVMAELDALNIRYAGNLKAAGLLRQAEGVRRQSKMLAGAQLLKGVSSAYTAGRQLRQES